MFAQAVYLMFSSVYVCKETVEHLLLSSGEGHHHHHSDDIEELGCVKTIYKLLMVYSDWIYLPSVEFPIFMILFTFISLLGTAIFYQNNTTIVNGMLSFPTIYYFVDLFFSVTGNRIPSLGSIIRSLWSTSRHTHELPPTTTLALIFSNPFIAYPLFFCVSILFVCLILSPYVHFFYSLFPLYLNHHLFHRWDRLVDNTELLTWF